MQNPFTARNMIRDIEGFFGRTVAVTEIFSNMQAMQSTSIVGERRCGKSSLLWHIAQPEVHRQSLTDDDRPYVFVFVDLQAVAGADPEAFFKLVTERLVLQDVTLSREHGRSPSSYRDHFAELINSAEGQFRIVLCLDEFETVTTNSAFDGSFLLFLRSFANAGKLAYITASRDTLDGICANTSHLQGSDFWNIFVIPPLYLAMLETDEAHELVTSVAGRSGITFHDDDIGRIQGLAGNHPLFLQVASFYSFKVMAERDAATGTDPISDVDWRQIESDFEMAATPHFEHIWKRLNTEERHILGDPGGIDPQGDLKTPFRFLLKRGLLQNGGRARVFSDSFATFCRQQRPSDRGAAVLAEPPAVTENQTTSSGRLSVWIGDSAELLVEFDGPFHVSKFCQNRAQFDRNTVRRFNSRTRNLPQVDNWRLEKQEIGSDVKELFAPAPELFQTYTYARGAVQHDEQLLLTFKSAQEMLPLPLEFIDSMSEVDDGLQHVVLRHPMRREVLGISFRRSPPREGHFTSGTVRILLVASNVHGSIVTEGHHTTLPSIPGAESEVAALANLLKSAKHCQVRVSNNPTIEELRHLLENEDYDVLHFCGHALHADNPEASCLCLRSGRAECEIDQLSAPEIHGLVEQTNLRFVYLSCCQGAMSAGGEILLHADFLGIAHSLLVGGVPAVLAMRWPLDDEMAQILAGSFYRAVLQGVSLELALLRARKTVYRKAPNDHTWLSPVFVARG